MICGLLEIENYYSSWHEAVRIRLESLFQGQCYNDYLINVLIINRLWRIMRYGFYTEQLRWLNRDAG